MKTLKMMLLLLISLLLLQIPAIAEDDFLVPENSFVNEINETTAQEKPVTITTKEKKEEPEQAKGTLFDVPYQKAFGWIFSEISKIDSAQILSFQTDNGLMQIKLDDEIINLTINPYKDSVYIYPKNVNKKAEKLLKQLKKQ